jgi:hypothetical protein
MPVHDARYEEYLEAVRRRVCTVCLDRRDDGSCGLSHRTCAIEAHLPHVGEAVLKIESARMDEYVAAIETQICGRCESGPAERCGHREKGECALDTYLYLVVAAVPDVRRDAGWPPLVNR